MDEDKEGGLELRFKTPFPEYLGIYFNPEDDKIEIMYWRDINNPSSYVVYLSSNDYKECLTKFLNSIL